MKIMTILGTRPEIIRLSLVIPLLDRHCEHVLVHTGQNYDDRLNRFFFEDLRVRAPDVQMGAKADTFAGQIGRIMESAERLFLEHRPDRLLILGDTNSGLAAFIAKRMGIPVYHMEAGNRCYDDRVPEEVNRRVIDHSSSVLMPYTERSRANLLAEGIEGERIYVTGNPIKEVIDFYKPQIAASEILDQLRLKDAPYYLVTMHRAENVDIESRLVGLVEALNRIASTSQIPVVVSVHPRTKARMHQYGISTDSDAVRFLEPFGFFDFIKLEKNATCLLSDSGTVQEEACLFGVPNVTIRDVTERPETIECGSNILSGVDPVEIVEKLGFVTTERRRWTPPPEYLATGVADTVCRILLGHRMRSPAEKGWSAGRMEQEK